MNVLEKLKRITDVNAYKTLWLYAEGYKLQLLKVIIIKVALSFIGIYIALVTKDIIDLAIGGAYTKAIRSSSLFIVLLMSEIAIDSYLSNKLLHINVTFRNLLQLQFIDNIYDKKWLEINKYNTGDLATRLYNDINNIVNTVTNNIPSIIALFFQVVMGFAFLAYYDMTLALITFIITPVSIIATMIIGLKLKKIQSKIQTEESTLRSKTAESFSNLTILKVFNYKRHNLDEIQSIQQTKYNYLKQRNTLIILSNIILSIGYNIGFFAAIAIGALRISTASISFGTLTAFIQLVGRIQGPMHNMASEVPSLISSFSSIDRIEELKNIPNEQSYDVPADPSLIPLKLNIKNVSFAYKKNMPVLKGINLEIPIGHKIAIVGSSGQGKTTLINILLALIEPDSGTVSITYNNGTVLPMSANYRNLFAYVSQTNMLFTGTIRDNFLQIDHTTEEDIEKALIVACCDTFINTLEDKLDTQLLEDGLGLSQGQLQRLSIARALIHNRPFLIFDEATSALDSETEARLIANIKDQYKDITLIAVTHREELLSICDRVYRMGEDNFEPLT